MTVAKAGSVPHFSRMLSFREAGGSRGRIEMVDTLNAGLDGQVSYATVLDAEKRSQCKLSGNDATDVITDISNPLDKDPLAPVNKEIVPIDDKIGSPEPTPVPGTKDPVPTASPVQKTQTPVQK